jgi:glyoxylase-like metal-dependent hydrolase (beta-lactamase superfamily II)/rhodanese-related sulfurtransferase
MCASFLIHAAQRAAGSLATFYNRSVVRQLSAEQLRDALDAHEPLTLVDVRPTAERAEWAIPGSLHVDAYESLRAGDRSVLSSFAAGLPKDRPVVTVCARGRTSGLAAEALDALGFEVFSLAGGMAAWSGAWNTAAIALPPRSRARIVQVRRTGKGCLSYIVGCDADAAAIDPAVDPAVYIAVARKHGWRITAVLDTHVHADHLTRAFELAERCSAPVYLPEQRRVSRAHRQLADGQDVAVGQARLRALRTPGHTHESTCYLVDDVAVCTGDTLFLNTVGRPDLAAADAQEPRQRAAALYRSLRERLLGLPDDMMVLPGHSSEALPFDGAPFAAPLADVRGALTMARLNEDEFVSTVLARIPATPANHLQIVRINEGKELPPEDLVSLEAGANRCAISA